MSIFGATEAPGVINPNDFGSDAMQLTAFQDQLTQMIDSVQPRLASIERKVSQSQTMKSTGSTNISSDLQSKLKEIQTKIPDIHNISVQLSRKAQNLSLNYQTVSSIGAPKLLKPIQDNFFALKEEFDQSLKNIATLSKNLSNKMDLLGSTIESMRSVPKSIEKLKKDLKQMQESTIKNADQLEQMKQSLIDNIDQVNDGIAQKFESQIKDAENLIASLEKQTTEGLSGSSKTSTQLQNEKFDIRTSFDSLSTEIDKQMDDRLRGLHAKVKKASEQSLSMIESIQSDLSRQLDLVTEETSTCNHYTIFDEIQQEKELTEADELITRINNLKEAINNSDFTPVNIDNDTDQYTENNLDEYQVMIGGRKTTVHCHPDGTFTY